MCQNGPYIFDDSLHNVDSPEGIGSSVEHMKLSILLSRAFELTLIPNPYFFKSADHHTDFMSRLGWDLGVDCHHNDVFQAMHGKGHNFANVTLISISMPDDNMIERKQYSELRELCHLIEQTTSNSIKQKNELIKNALIGGWINQLHTGLQQYHLLNNSIDKYNQHLKNTVFVLKRDYWNNNFEGYECCLEFIRNKFILANNKLLNEMNAPCNINTDHNNNNTIITETERTTNTVTINNIGIIAIKNYDPTQLQALNILNKNYNTNPKLQISVHFRSGDVAEIQDLSTLTIPLETIVDIVRNLLSSQNSVLRYMSVTGSGTNINSRSDKSNNNNISRENNNNRQQEIELHFYSQGNLSQFHKFYTHFPHTEFHLEQDQPSLNNDNIKNDQQMQLNTNEIAMEHFNSMVNSDILITSPSAFSSLIAALNINGIILVPSEQHNKQHPKMSHKFDYLPNIIQQQSILNNDLSEFNYMFCHKRKHYLTQHLPRECHKPEFTNPYTQQNAYLPQFISDFLEKRSDNNKNNKLHNSNGDNNNTIMMDKWGYLIFLLICIVVIQCFVMFRRNYSIRRCLNTVKNDHNLLTNKPAVLKTGESKSESETSHV